MPAANVTVHGQNLQQAQPQPTFVVPPYEQIFPLVNIHSRIRGYLDNLSSATKHQSSSSSSFRDVRVQEFIHYVRHGTVGVWKQQSVGGGYEDSTCAVSVAEILSKPHCYQTLFPGQSPPTAAEEAQIQQRLRSNPYILLGDKLTLVTPAMHREITSLSEELNLRTIAATALYAEASNAGTREWLKSKLRSDVGVDDGGYYCRFAEECKEDSMQTDDLLGAAKLVDVEVLTYARELYFHEKSCLLNALGMLVKHRLGSLSEIIEESSMGPLSKTAEGSNNGSSSRDRGFVTTSILEATDCLLRSVPDSALSEGVGGNLISNLILSINDLSGRIVEVSNDIHQNVHLNSQATMTAPEAAFAGFGAVPSQQQSFGYNQEQEIKMERLSLSQKTKIVFRLFYWEQQQQAAECLFYLLFHTQATADEVAKLIDLIQKLTYFSPEKNDATVVVGAGTSRTGERTGINKDGLPILDSIKDVPPVYRNPTQIHPYGQQQQQQQQQSSQQFDQITSFSFVGNSTHGEEKTRNEWEKELFQSLFEAGKPQLLMCVNVLILAVVCALDCTNVLMDRERHGPNVFGVGNALLPPAESGTPPSEALEMIHMRLVEPSSIHGGSWSRLDIWGLLSSCYALLLRPIAVQFDDKNETFARTSPADIPPGQHIFPPPITQTGAANENVENTELYGNLVGPFHLCLMAAATYKSLTFMRTTLLPCVGGSSSSSLSVSMLADMPLMSFSPAVDDCDSGSNDAQNIPFYTSVLAEFASKYLQTLVEFGELPISRRRWREDTESELHLQRLHQEQRRQFSMALGQDDDFRQDDGNVEDKFEVDFSTRPDCLDDVIALVVAICMACPPRSILFWDASTIKENIQSSMEWRHEDGLVSGSPSTNFGHEPSSRRAGSAWKTVLHPPAALMELERLFVTDNSLLSSYLSFLSALALAQMDDESETVAASTLHDSSSGEATAPGVGRSDNMYVMEKQAMMRDSAGALAVHNMLHIGKDSDSTAGGSELSSPGPTSLDWPYIVRALHWFAEELSKVGEASSGHGSTFQSTPHDTAFTAAAVSPVYLSSYYYRRGQSDSIANSSAYPRNTVPDSRGGPSTTDHQNQSSVASSSMLQNGQPSHRNSILNDENMCSLLSLLNMIACVSARSVTARMFILNTFVSTPNVMGSSPSAPAALSFSSFTPTLSSTFLDNTNTQGNRGNMGVNILRILFALASIKPGLLPTRVKGAIYTTLATLIHGSSDACNECWELLEKSQVVPTIALSQYSTGASPPTSVGASTLQFPSYGSGPTRSASVTQSNLGILYEIDYIESPDGKFPITEGLLLLLTSLLQTVGCPPLLGAIWRRPGVAPYIEFVTSYLLPRAVPSTAVSSNSSGVSVGVSGIGGILNFELPSDRYRLLSRALDVLVSVVVRYPVPPPFNEGEAREHEDSSAHARFHSHGPGNEMFSAPSFVNASGIYGEIASSARGESSKFWAALANFSSAISSAERMGLCPSLGLFYPSNAFSRKKTGSDVTGAGDLIYLPTIPELEDAAKDFIDEWVDPPPQVRTSGNRVDDATASNTGTSPSVPRAKSPGFTLLVEVLSGHRLLKELLLLLVQDGGSNGMRKIGNDINMRMRALALFNFMPGHAIVQQHAMESMRLMRQRPSTLAGQQSQWYQQQINQLRKTLLNQHGVTSIMPQTVHPVFDSVNYFSTPSFVAPVDVICWRERCAATSLQIICACAAREDQFTRALQGCSIPLTIVPVLRFASQVTAPASLEIRDVSNLYRLSNLLQASSGAPPFNETAEMEPLPCIAQYVGYRSISTPYIAGERLAQSAVALLAYCTSSLSPHAAVTSICGRSANGGQRLAQAFAKRLLMPCFGDYGAPPRRSVGGGFNLIGREFFPDMLSLLDVRAVILDLLLSNLTRSVPNLAHVLLGFASSDQDTASFFSSVQPGQSPDCLSAVLFLLEAEEFVLQAKSAPLAARCFELLYQLCLDTAPSNGSTYRRKSGSVSSLLRSKKFWFRQCQRYLFPLPFSGGQEPPPSDGGPHISLLEVICNNADHPEGQKSRNHVLHSVAWLLKGVSLELYSVIALKGGNNSSAQPNECRQLLTLLFGCFFQHESLASSSFSSSPMLEALRNLPIRSPGGAVSVRVVQGTNPPPNRSLLKASTHPLPGQRDVFGGFEVINLNEFAARMKAIDAYDSARLLEALRWANDWNGHVTAACASSHLAKAWATVVSVAVVSSKSLSVGNETFGLHESLDMLDGQTNTLLDCKGILSLMNAILVRLTTHEEGLEVPSGGVEQALRASSYVVSDDDRRSAAIRNESLLQQQAGGDGDIEAKVAFPLSIVVLRLVCLLTEIIDSPVLNGHGLASFSDIGATCALLARAVAACAAGGAHETRAGILSCSLVLLLQRVHHENVTLVGHSSTFSFSSVRNMGIITDSSVDAAVHLSSLATMNVITETGSAGFHIAHAIASAARAGLCSLVVLSDTVMDEDQLCRNSFLSHIFFDVGGKARLSRMIRLLGTSDVNISWLLIRLAKCHGGAQMLLENGAPGALLATTTDTQDDFLPENSSLDVVPMGWDIESASYGGIIIEPPPCLLGHLKLLNTMLCALRNIGTLAVECGQFIRRHGSTCDRLLRCFPRDGDLTESFLTLLALTTVGLSAHDEVGKTSSKIRSKGQTVEGVLGKFLPRLERRVIDFALHIAAFPFPDRFMPDLPPPLREAEQTRMSKMRQKSLSPGKSWWDLLPSIAETAVESGMDLGNPPTVSLIPSFGSRRSGEFSPRWTQNDYAYAILAANSMEGALTFLKSRASGHNNITLPLDAVAVAKAFCRCADASRAIEMHLGLVDESELSSALQTDTWAKGNIPKSKTAKYVEREALLTLGPVLGRSMEGLLTLVSLHMQCLLRDMVGTGGRAGLTTTRNVAKEFAHALTQALEYTQVEQLGVACVGLGVDNKKRCDFGKKIARNLRAQLHEVEKF